MAALFRFPDRFLLGLTQNTAKKARRELSQKDLFGILPSKLQEYKSAKAVVGLKANFA
jgi:hypothetical protein